MLRVSERSQCIKEQRHHFANKGPSTQSYGFPISHVWIWELDHKEGWSLKKWCFRIVVLEKTLESSLDNREIKPVNPKGNQPWIFIGRTDAETPILWPPDAKSRLIGKDLYAGKDWGAGGERGKQSLRYLDSFTNSMDMSFSKLWEIVKDSEAWFVAVHEVANSQTWLSHWTTTIRSRKYWSSELQVNKHLLFLWHYICDNLQQ